MSTKVQILTAEEQALEAMEAQLQHLRDLLDLDESGSFGFQVLTSLALLAHTYKY